MDVEGLEALVARLAGGEIRVVARDLTEPSPLAAEVLDARPYAFLDDAPLEERRTRAVSMRRGLDPESAADIGRLDPEAIERVREEAWPEAATPDELHDALVVLGFATAAEGVAGRLAASMADAARRLANGERPGWSAHFDALVASGRATRYRPPRGGPVLWCAAERLALLEAALGAGRADPPLVLPEELRAAPGRDAALVELLRARLGCLGPATAARLARDLGLAPVDVEVALVALEAEGCVLRGRFTEDAASIEWCDRRLLARIHRYTLGRLRREIEPATRAEFMRYLFEWQQVRPDDRRQGFEALAAVAAELEGFAAPAAAWEAEILPARIADFAPEMLESALPCRPGLVGEAGPPEPRDPGPVVRADPLDPDRPALPPPRAAVAGAGRGRDQGNGGVVHRTRRDDPRTARTAQLRKRGRTIGGRRPPARAMPPHPENTGVLRPSPPPGPHDAYIPGNGVSREATVPPASHSPPCAQCLQAWKDRYPARITALPPRPTGCPCPRGCRWPARTTFPRDPRRLPSRKRKRPAPITLPRRPQRPLMPARPRRVVLRRPPRRNRRAGAGRGRRARRADHPRARERGWIRGVARVHRRLRPPPPRRRRGRSVGVRAAPRRRHGGGRRRGGRRRDHRAHPAAPLRRRVQDAPRARIDHRPVAGPAARAPPPRSARRDPRGAVRRGASPASSTPCPRRWRP